MSDNEKLVEYRITQLELGYKSVNEKLDKVQELVTRIDKKLAGIPDAGLACGIHQMRIDDNAKRLEAVEEKTEKLTKKIITATAIASVLLFILTQLVIPYVLNNVKVSARSPEVSQTSTNTNHVAYTTIDEFGHLVQ